MEISSRGTGQIKGLSDCGDPGDDGHIESHAVISPFHFPLEDHLPLRSRAHVELCEGRAIVD
jgi:hypothetical protein